MPVAGRFHRAEGNRADRPHWCFAVTTGIGLKELCDGFRAKNDDYNAIMAEAIADRLAEAFAECLHKRVRDEWAMAEEHLTTPRSSRRNIGESAGAGIPGVPDHTEKATCGALDVETNTGMLITESFAMWPGSSVSGLYFAHPESRYFSWARSIAIRLPTMPRARG